MAGDATTLTVGQGSHGQRWIGTSVRLITTIAVLAGVGALVLPPRTRTSAQSSLASLVSASSTDARPIEPRLSGGFAWAPFRSATRDHRRADNALANAISETLAGVRGEATPTAQQTAGVAQLLAGNARQALASLKTAAEPSDKPAAWNDLAAAYFETARIYDAPELLADALAASDRALSLNPQFAEALFNRALVIERLGLKDDAREAWRRYLSGDTTEGWADEARNRIKALAPEEDFLGLLDRQYDRVIKDPAAATALVRRDPFSARGLGVKEVLGRWGKAVLRGDQKEADRHLAVARRVGAAVALGGGDHMLERAVTVIDQADGLARTVLASAHADYQDGLKSNDARRPGDAETLFRRAAASFEKARSPMVSPARFYVGAMLSEQGRPKDAEREIESLELSEDFPGYQAIRLRQLGAFHLSRADWGEAIRILKKSESLYDRLGEIQRASDVRRLLSIVYDQTGDPATAWKYRLSALQGMGVRSDTALEKTVASVADAAMLRREWRTALSFLDIEIRIAQRLHDDLQLAATLLFRAVVRDRLNDVQGALDDVTESKAVLARIKDPAYAAYLRVASLRASAMLTTTPPQVADAQLSEAIGYQAAQGDPLRLPDLYLQRARARRRIGNVAGAKEDLQSGIAGLERHRESLPPGEARWGAFHAAEELFDEAIDLALTTNDAEAAFRFAEQARARALLDSYERSPVPEYRRLPSRTVVVEYVSLPSRLIIFTAGSSGVQAIAVECSREKLAAEVDALSVMVSQAKATVPSGDVAAMYRRLIEPVAPQLLGATTVVFVPDATTSPVPFSALADSRGEYLIEGHTIVRALSTAAFIAARERKGERGIAPRSALVVSNSDPAAGSGALAFADSEARQVARTYRSAKRLADDAANLDELTKFAPDADAIHFAGHAIGDDSGIEPASMVLRENGHERRVSVSDISKLHLRSNSVVVLAGCNTARGERRAAEGVISVAHGFLTAGAPSVIATLWPIDDEASSIFFPRLHRRLAEGIPPAEALREAQLESIRRGDVPASLWAAVQDIGN